MIIETSSTVYINHVPKCAGTTIVDLFCRSFPAVAVQDRFTNGSAQTLLPSDLVRKQLIAAHLPEWAMRRRVHADIKIGLARDPWSRFNSIVRHHLRDARSGASPPHVIEFTNLYVGGKIREAFDTIGDWYAHDSLIANYAADPLSAYPNLSRASESALERIETYDLIVCSEDLDELHPLLCRLAAQPESAARKLNAARDLEADSSDRFGPELMEQFRDRARAEYQVYARLRQHADQTAEKARATFREQPTYREVIAARAKGRPDIAVEAGDGLACAGWDRPVIATGGRHAGRYGLRMSAPEAFVDIGVTTGKRQLIELVLWIGGGLPNLRALELTVNDQHYSVEQASVTAIEDAHDRSCFTIFMEHEGIKDGFCRIALKRPQMTPGHADLWLFSVRVQAI